MGEKTKCYFTEASATEELLDVDSEARAVNSEILGKYGVSHGVVFLLNGIKEKTRRQGHANCALKIREARSESPHALPYFVLRSEHEAELKEFESLRQTGKKSIDDRMFLLFEDWFDMPVDHSETPYRLLRVLASKTAYGRPYSDFLILPAERVLAGIVDQEELTRVLEYLMFVKGLLDSSYIQNPGDLAMYSSNPRGISFRISISGWESLRDRSLSPNSNLVFIATQFIWDNNFPFRREEATSAISKACARLGFEAKPVTQNHTGYITDRIMNEIKASRFVVADLTYHNRGVYFESGFARGLGLPVFHVVHRDFVSNALDAPPERKMHFDVQQIISRRWSTPEDLESELYEWVLSRVGRFGEPSRVSI